MFDKLWSFLQIGIAIVYVKKIVLQFIVLTLSDHVNSQNGDAELILHCHIMGEFCIVAQYRI